MGQKAKSTASLSPQNILIWSLVLFRSQQLCSLGKCSLDPRQPLENTEQDPWYETVGFQHSLEMRPLGSWGGRHIQVMNLHFTSETIEKILRKFPQSKEGKFPLMRDSCCTRHFLGLFQTISSPFPLRAKLPSALEATSHCSQVSYSSSSTRKPQMFNFLQHLV